MNIAIVDDEPKEIDSFRSVIKEYSQMAGVEIAVSVFHSAEEFLKGYRPLAYTAIFMDIFMSGMTGVDAAKRSLKLTATPSLSSLLQATALWEMPSLSMPMITSKSLPKDRVSSRSWMTCS